MSSRDDILQAIRRNRRGRNAPRELASLDLLVCEGALAENGAVWPPASMMGWRAAPFLAQHLLLVLDRRKIAWDMHEAYPQIEVDAEGFGLCVAGPFKTADIEQSLVIGAHGPRSLTVVLTDRSIENKPA